MSERLTGRMVHRTTCSGCHIDLLIDRAEGVVMTRRPPRRGRVRQGPAISRGPLENDDNDLVTWECPAPGCAYADSLDLNA